MVARGRSVSWSSSDRVASLRQTLADGHRLGCATLMRSEAFRARQALWRAVFDLPQSAARFLGSWRQDGSCSVFDQTSFGDTLGSGPGTVPGSVEARSVAAGLQQLLLTSEAVTDFLDCEGRGVSSSPSDV